MALTKTNSDVVDIPDISIALADEPVVGGIKDLIDTKADIADPAFTGTPTAPTAPAGTSTTQIATTAFVNSISTGFESGVVMAFFQAAAPADWTQITTHNNCMLRIVNTAGGGSGGTHSPIEMLAAHVPIHTHYFTTAASDAPHSHTFKLPDGTAGGGDAYSSTYVSSGDYGRATASGNATHYHTGTTDNNSGSTSWTPKYLDMIICQKD